ncbi:alpha/beta-hydrolase [Lophiostoma macrostomum CBS 122681]|uniref:Carboxylic ester hydrolase n=1 Tax=Lophiostoma macrostomum CBS 122681 TaxID=1314788 RepID=A0A6A6SSX9_9PLEO|nr:alpha/beta-hydrolase [Lophiostoma macrostomum CBS 122681]
MRYGMLTALIATTFWGSSYAESFEAALPTATIDAGVIVGTTTSVAAATSVNQYLGIPFAASPPERFSPPEKPTQWSQPLDTKVRKPACVQQFNYPEASRNFTQEIFNNPPPEESEDCLYLNVFAPGAPAAGKGRAVLYWIYGGGLQFGDAGLAAYDGSFFATYEDVIVVTVNYRTNVFGFPNSPELPLAEQNLGFLDQRLGLDWVQRNIQAFGGDPDKVTIFGESAGAFSTDALLTSYPKNSAPPFRAAILQSGQISYPIPFYADTTTAWYALAASLNCTDQSSNLTCIRAASATTIKDAIEHAELTFNPVYDNITLVSNAAKRRTSGNIATIPVLSGTDAQEGRVLEFGQNNLTAYLTSLGLDSDSIAAVEAVYPVGGSEFPSDYDAIAQVVTDNVFQCADALFANASAVAGIPSWRYYFNASFPNTQSFPNAGVYHSSEIGIVFSTYPTENATAQEYALSNFMRGTWARFAKDPLAGPGWNAVGTGSDYYEAAADLDLGVIGANGSSGVTVVRQSEVDIRCKFWEPILTADT